MTITAIWRRAASLLAIGAVAVLLSGCLLTSEGNLVATGEAAQILPASFPMQPYNEVEGVFSPTADGSGIFTLKDGGYHAPDGSMTAYFVPLADDRYLLSLAAADGAIYGVARLRDSILELRVVFAGDPEAELASAGPTPADATFSEGGIAITDRASLDAIIKLMDESKLTTSPLVAWVGDGAAPARIVADGDWYKPES